MDRADEVLKKLRRSMKRQRIKAKLLEYWQLIKSIANFIFLISAICAWWYYCRTHHEIAIQNTELMEQNITLKNAIKKLIRIDSIDYQIYEHAIKDTAK